MAAAKLKASFGFLVLFCFGNVSADSSQECLGAGFIAASVVISVIVILLIVFGVYYWRKSRTKTEHLILQNDPEKGKSEYALDNPAFTDPCGPPMSKFLEKNSNSETLKSDDKLNHIHRSQTTELSTKTKPRRTLDDSVIDGDDVIMIALKSQDFAGLGFNICGNMKEGIYIKDILQRGPAAESGKLNPGDKIMSVTINFEHIVYEDAMNILSYASPYEVTIEAQKGKLQLETTLDNKYPNHPIFRSSSSTNVSEVDKSNLSLPRRNMNTVASFEREVMKSLDSNLKNSKSFEKIKQLEQNLSPESEVEVKTQSEIQKSENKYQKFGVQVLPTPKEHDLNKTLLNISGKSENDFSIRNNDTLTDLDEVDTIKPQPEIFERNGSFRGSNVRRDSNGIPQEIPSHMLNAAVAARRNRRGSEETSYKKSKGKAPAPPPEDKILDRHDEVNYIFDEVKLESSQTKDDSIVSSNKTSLKEYSSDSDEGVGNKSSINTIELNSSDITIHQGEDDEKLNRRTASTGDLTKIHKTKNLNTGTLERAQSLDITDSVALEPTLIEKNEVITKDELKKKISETDIFGDELLNKDPRLSFMLDSLNTFQRKRLKKSTEWGNLEDAILKSNRDNDDYLDSVDNVTVDNPNFNLNVRAPELNALVSKIDEIRRESMEIDENSMKENLKNEIWPTEIGKPVLIESVPPAHNNFAPIVPKIQNLPQKNKIQNHNTIWPKELEHDSIDNEIGQSTKEILSGQTTIHLKQKLGLDDGNVSEEKSQTFTFPTQVDVNKIEIDNNFKPIQVHYNESFYDEKKSTDSGDKEISIVLENNKVQLGPETSIINKKNSGKENIQETELINQLEKEHKVYTATKPSDVNVENMHKHIGNEYSESQHEMKIYRRQQIPKEKLDTILPPTETEINIELVNDLEKNVHQASPNHHLVIEPSTAIPESSSFVTSHVEMHQSFPEMNNTDECKTTFNIHNSNNLNDSEIFILNERHSCLQDEPNPPSEDINVSDDIKVSRHSLGTLDKPKSDDAKSIESLKCSSNVSNITINSYQDNGLSGLHSLEFSVNDPSEERNASVLSDNELYQTALNKSIDDELETSKITIKTPELIENVTLAEAIIDASESIRDQNNSLSLSIRSNDGDGHSVTVNNYLIDEQFEPDELSSNNTSIVDIETKKQFDSTYVTEIQVTPNSNVNNSNKSEIEISPSLNEKLSLNLDSKFEDYIKNSEQEHYERPVIEEKSKKENGHQTISSEIDPEKELLKIREIAQEQLKKLPEMRFSTRSYENPSRTTEKSQSQIELLRSNFEKSPIKSPKSDNVGKSRIPVSTTTKIVPLSPERNDIRNIYLDNGKETIDSPPSIIHSTPLKNPKTTNKNITITSIKNNSKIPSGLPVLGHAKPSISPRKFDPGNDSSNSNINSFKQWVFESNTSINNYKQE